MWTHCASTCKGRKRSKTRSSRAAIQFFFTYRNLKTNFSINDNIWLKIDIEGAEYEVLKHLIDTNIIIYIKKLFIEFHYEKINLDINIHNEIKFNLKDIFIYIPWGNLAIRKMLWYFFLF